MATFYDLEIDKFYLIRVSDNLAVSMVQVALATNHCVLVYEVGEVDINYWKKKSDYIAEIVEELTDDMVDEYEALLMEDFDDYDEDDVEDISIVDDSKDDHDEHIHASKKKKKKKKK